MQKQSVPLQEDSVRSVCVVVDAKASLFSF